MANQVVGNPTPRVEGELKVTGKAMYTVDRTLPGMLWGKVLRSPIAFGRIKNIDVSKALQLPGVKDRLQVFVFYFDEFQGLFGDFFRLRCNGCNLLSHESHYILGENRHIVNSPSYLEASYVLSGYHGFDSRELERFHSAILG